MPQHQTCLYHKEYVRKYKQEYFVSLSVSIGVLLYFSPARDTLMILSWGDFWNVNRSTRHTVLLLDEDYLCQLKNHAIDKWSYSFFDWLPSCCKV